MQGALHVLLARSVPYHSLSSIVVLKSFCVIFLKGKMFVTGITRFFTCNQNHLHSCGLSEAETNDGLKCLPLLKTSHLAAYALQAGGVSKQ